MTRTFLSALLVASALVGCNRDGSMHSENASSQQSSQSAARSNETQPAQNPDAEEIREERQEAVADLPEQLDETERARQRATEEAGRLAMLVNQACEGIASEEKDVCPIDGRHVRTIRDVEGGVALQLNPNAGDEALIQRRVDCYSAIAQVRANEAAVAVNPDPANVTPTTEITTPTPARAACVLDVPNTTVDVEQASGGVRVELTSHTAGYALEIREQARHLVQRPRGARR